MTLNGHFVLKSILGSACHGFVCSHFSTKLFGKLQSYAYCHQQKCSPETMVSGDMFYAVIHCVAMKKDETRELYSQHSYLLFTNVYEISNIQRISKVTTHV